MKRYINASSRFFPYILIAISTVILLIRATYSFCWSDETLYFSTCNRFYMGDSVFLHEWFPTQLISVALLPFYAAYLFITGSSAGVILYFRILYVILSTVDAVVTYRILKQHVSPYMASVSSLLLMFYAHLNIATLSYYTLSVQMYLLSMLLIYHYQKSAKKWHLVVSGVLFAIAVLALPSLALAYFAVVLLILILLASVRFIRLPDDIKAGIEGPDLSSILKYTFLGILIPAVLFLIFLLNNVSVTDFIRGLPYVLTDEEHGTSLIYPLRKFFISINEVYGYGGYISYLLILGSFIASFFKISKDKRFITGVFTADTLLLIYLFTCSFGHTGYIQTTLCLYLIPLFFLTEKRDMRLFWTLMVSGMVLSLVYSYSSNGYLYVLSMGHFITCIGCIVAADRFMEETRTLSRIYPVILTIVICLSLIQTMTLRIVNIYRDAPVEMLTSRITEGPAKGLWTTPEHKEAYDRVYSTIMNECQSADLNSTGSGDGRGNIFITRILPWGYMCTDLRCASPTTWRTPFNSERLEPYYEMNPDRYPDMILVLDKEYGSFLTCGDVEADPCPNENDTGGFLRDYIDANDFEILNVECGTLYKRR